MVTRPRSTLRLALMLAPFAFLGGMVADRAVFAARESSGTYRQLDLFARVLSYVQNNYVEEVGEKQLIQGAIKGLIGTLDPHTLFMPPEVFKDMKIDTTGEFGGLGIEISSKVQVRSGVRSESLVVVAPIDDTPAFRAGIHAGDVILKIDGESAAEMDVVTAIARMRGPAGTKVTLNILRDGFAQPRDIVIVRDHIRIVSVEGRLYEGYAYVRVKSFQEHTDRFLKRALDDLRAQNKGELRGLVLDLRNNPGGLLEQAVRISDRFLRGGLTIVTTKGRGGKHVEEEKSHDRDTEPLYPVIVLVNGGSASASEIVAGALQDHARAVVMGTQSFGKGSVQTLIELDDGSGLKLTIARYFTPKGRSIQQKGITPDVIVGEASDESFPREADLRNHFRNDAGEPRASPAPAVARDLAPAPRTADARPGQDYVLKTALDYLRTWQIFKTNAVPTPPPGKAARAP